MLEKYAMCLWLFVAPFSSWEQPGELELCDQAALYRPPANDLQPQFDNNYFTE